jgi:hypothetical protein
MDELGLFTAALGLSGPWRVVRTEFDVEGTQLDLYLDFERGARFTGPAKDCAQGVVNLVEMNSIVNDIDADWERIDKDLDGFIENVVRPYKTTRA